MAIQEGEKLPEATLHTMQDGRPNPVTTADLFGGKKVVLFAVPGAFTPTCSQAHLPGYVVHADEIKAKGVDSIVCLSVNDAFVMGAWGDSANAEAIQMVGDGNGDFTSAIGLEMDSPGRRIQRLDNAIQAFKAYVADAPVEIENPAQMKILIDPNA